MTDKAGPQKLLLTEIAKPSRKITRLEKQKIRTPQAKRPIRTGILNESEKRFLALYRSMREMVVFHEIVADTSGRAIDYRILDCNPAFTKVTGISRKSAVGKLASQLYGTGSPPFLEEYARAAGRGESFTFETEFSPMGKCFSVSVVGSETGHFTTITTDITEQKNAVDHLHKEMVWKHFLIDLYKNGPRMTDSDLYNYVLEEVVRMTESEIGFLHLVHDDQKSITLTAWNRKALENCAVPPVTHYSIDQAGNWVDCVSLKRPVIYNDFPGSPNRKGLPDGHVPLRRFMSVPVIENNKVEIVFGVGNKIEEYNERDVTQLQIVANDLGGIVRQRHLDIELHESEKSHRLLFETITQGVIYYGAGGEIVSANPAAERILGLSQGKMLGKTLMNLGWKVVREDGSVLPVDEHPFRVVLQTGKPVRDFIMGLSGPGRGIFLWLSVTEIPLFQPGETEPFQVYSVFADITKEKEMSSALLESEVKYRTVVENSLVGVFIVQDGLFRFVNRRWCEIYGYKADEITDKVDPFDLIHPGDRESAKEIVSKRRSGGAARTERETRSVRKDGKVITLKILGSEVLYQGRPASLGTVIDLTEQKRSEEELEQKTAFLEALNNASLDGIIAVDKNKKIFQNQQTDVLLKIPRHIAEDDDDEAQIKWVAGQTKDPEKFCEKVNYMFSHPGETMRDELEFKDGTVLDRYTGPVIGKDGQNHGRIWTFRDITQRRDAEKTVRISQLRLSEAMDIAQIVYWDFDCAENRFIFNDPFYAFYGTTAEQEGGYRMARDEYARRFVHPDDLLTFQQCVEQNNLRPDREFISHTEHRIVRRDGEVRHISARARITRDKSGLVVSRSGANQDITERKRAEDALRQSEERLHIALEAAHAGAWEWDLSTSRNAWSDELWSLYGLDQHECEPSFDSWLCSVHPDDRARVSSIVSETASRGADLNVEWRSVDNKDNSRWLMSRGKPFRGPDGQVVRYAGIVIDITERRYAEEMLREKDAIFQAFMEHSPIYVFFKDHNSRSLSLSRNYEKLMGMPVEEILGKTRDDLMPSDHAKAMIEDDKRMLAHEESVQYDEEVNGRYYTTIKFPIHMEGRPSLIAGFTMDLTQRKRAEDEIRMLKHSIDVYTDGAYWMNSDNEFVYINDAGCKALGYERDEIIGKTIETVNPRATSDRMKAVWEGLRKGGSFTTESVHRRKDGGEFPVEVITTYVQFGGREYACGFARDITERKRVEETLRERDAIFEAFMKYSPVYVFFKDHDIRVINLSSNFEKMLGMPVEKMLGKTMHDLFPSDLAQTMVDHDRRVLAERRFVQVDEELGERYYRTMKFPIELEGKPPLLAGFTIDITEQKRSAEEKAHLEAQLHQAQKMEAVGTLAGGIAHDFNNILTVITGFAALIKRALERNEPVVSDHIDQIETAAEKAANLTRGLLTLSRKQQVNLEKQSINEIVVSTGKLLKRLLTEDIELRISLDVSEPYILADTTQIDQILLNLTANARDAMPRGGLLTIRTETVEMDARFVEVHGYGQTGTYALLSFSDTGTGMDKATRERVFEPFFTTKEVNKGTGLGLSTVYGIVEKHGGYISVYSEPHQGTTFRIYFPVVNPEEKSEPVSRRLNQTGTETILVVEDDPGVRLLTNEILRTFGYKTITAEDGEKALKIFSKNNKRIDLVILDVVMPKMNGKEVYEKIKELRPDAKVIFTSGYMRDTVIDKGVVDEKTDFLSKPILPDALLKKVREVLDR